MQIRCNSANGGNLQPALLAATSATFSFRQNGRVVQIPTRSASLHCGRLDRIEHNLKKNCQIVGISCLFPWIVQSVGCSVSAILSLRCGITAGSRGAISPSAHWAVALHQAPQNNNSRAKEETRLRVQCPTNLSKGESSVVHQFDFFALLAFDLLDQVGELAALKELLFVELVGASTG